MTISLPQYGNLVTLIIANHLLYVLEYPASGTPSTAVQKIFFTSVLHFLELCKEGCVNTPVQDFSIKNVLASKMILNRHSTFMTSKEEGNMFNS